MTRVTSLAYGAARLPLPPALAAAPQLDAPGLAPAADPDGLWRDACAAAAGRLAGTLAARDRLALIVPDRTRALPLPALLPPLLETLAAAGIGTGRVTLVPASGIHRPMPAAEFADWIGNGAAVSGALLAQHDADRPAVVLGRTPCGIDVAAHPAVARAGAVLAIGRIVFHYLAGFGGGRKMLVPGVSARRTILAVHSRCLHPRPGGGRHPRSANGVLEGNPVHAAASAAARLFPPAVALHVSLGGGAIARVTAGDLFDDHAAAARAYGDANAVTLDTPLDAVVVGAGGLPSDRDLVQAHKALEAIAPVVRDGGTVVLVAECADGIGNPEVEEALGRGGPDEIEAALRSDFRVGAHTALALRLKSRRLRVLALTALPDEALALAGMGRVASLDEAARVVEAATRVAIAPRGGSLLYRLPA